jgi:protoporphyrinogen IX oxidase
MSGWLWVKALHIVLVVSWFAGLFYLPRIFVNLAMVPQAGDERTRLLTMARKLYRFVTPIGVLALAVGLWLWLGFGVGRGESWMSAKLAVAAALVGYHGVCGRLLAGFERGTVQRSHVWFRYFNEIPVLLLVAAVILVVVKPSF